VPIASEDCAATFEPSDLAADDTIWIGAMFPTRGPRAADFGTMNAEGVEFARRDVASATRALVGGSDGGTRVRRLALVTCDDGTDPARAARHLVDDVGVPAIVGFGSGQTLVDLAGSLLIPRRVLSLATLTQSPLVTRVPQPADLPRMVWRTTYSAHDAAAATALMLRDALAPHARASARPVRVAVGRSDAAAGLWFGEEFYRHLSSDGKAAPADGVAYAEIVVPLEKPSDEALHALADRIVATDPTFVVFAGETVVTAPLAEAIEARWPAGNPKPTYLLSDASTEPMASFMGTNVDRRRRVFAVTSVSSDLPIARFVLRYNAAHAQPVTAFFNPASSYDAFFVLAYATFAVGDGAVDGPALGRAITRLVPPGRVVDVGPMPLFEGISALRAGETIDLRGASAGLDFDLATGEAPSDFALVCAGVDASRRATGDVEAGVYYRVATHAVEGTLHCP
jgi:branched-chain amino acid transport system substrate-binding protein